MSVHVISAYERDQQTRTLTMSVNKLFRALHRQYGSFPDNYLVIDLETTGLAHESDLVGKIGHCQVVNRRPVGNAGVILNWTVRPDVDQAWLIRRLAETKYQFEHDKNGQLNGRHYQLSIERMVAEGADPVTVLAFYLDWLFDCRRDGVVIVAHNGYNFDCPFLETAFRRFLGANWKFGNNDVFDTGMIEKASQLQLLPWAEESIRAYSKRIYNQRAAGVYWALDSHCNQKYRLGERHGITMASLHEPEMDALLTHHLFEEFRRLAEESINAQTQPASRPQGVRQDPGQADPFPAHPGL